MATKQAPTIYKSLNAIFVDLASILKPAEELTVSQAAEKYRYLNNAGAYVGKWLNHKVPAMVEPMDIFTSRKHSGMIFVGPAQCGKTDSLILNTLAYSIVCEPMDTMLVCPTMADGRDFSIRRIDRMHLHSQDIGSKLLPGADADNKFDKQYRNGMLFTIGWPTESQLAGKPIPRMVITDRDRMPDDIEGAGEVFDLASMRTTTFGSYAMTLAESSPSRQVTDMKWIARTPHEAPPCEGILKLYNRGDRRRWYWPCPHCDEFFEGTFDLLEWDADLEGSNMEKAETTFMRCPHCQGKIHPDERDSMQQWGVWLKDGQGIDKLGRVTGPSPRTMIASFWLNGVAASFTTWRKLVNLFLDANDEYERTGSEEGLKKFYNNNLGLPYYPKSMTDDLRSPEVLKGRSEKDLPERQVPEGVRFLVALCDVQKNMWVVQVFGILPGQRFDTVLIDRFDVRKSKRTDPDGDALWVKPNAYLEDWDELTEHVIEKQYPLGDGSGRKMGIRFVGCDSGGKEGVTTMAYNFYRRLRDQNKHRRFILIKGDPSPNNPRTRISYPDSSRKDSKAGARGDIPVLMLNSNVLKDDLNGRLDCMEPGKGMYRTPDWLSDSFYSELCAEIRTPKGWENPAGERNEAWDLSYYCIGLCVSELLGIERLDWNSPPGWAAEWDKNDLVSKPDEAPRFAHSIESNYDFAQFAKALA
jgi:phage terminase large subunit GpA-like protein